MTTEELQVIISANTQGLRRAMTQVNGSMQSAQTQMQSANRTMGSAFKGAGLAVAKFAKVAVIAGATAAGAIGGLALKSAVDYEKQMANVATLLGGDVKKKIESMSGAVKKLSTDTGTSTELLTDGLYQVVSAFGETDDAMKILEISTKGAAAGNATVTDSVNLLSAVTKGYGDTSSEAAQKASDLAFLTVKMGQTTFPELANSLGKVIPLSASLKVEQEQLFGAMATLTGVTGNTAEVSTQLRGVMQGLLKPSDGMTTALKKMGFESGGAAIESLGLQGTLEGLKGTVKGNDTELLNMFGSVEAGSAVLALTGSQAENFATKTAEMGKAAGATESAFKTQQATVAASMAKIKASLNVVMIELGEKFLPAFEKLLQFVIAHMPQIKETIGVAMDGASKAFDLIITVVGKTIEALKKVGDWATEHKTALENIGIVIGSIAIAWGLVTGALAIWNTVGVVAAGVTWLMTYGTTAFGLAMLSVSWPLVAVIAGIAAVIAIGILLYKNWDTVKAFMTKIFNKIKEVTVNVFTSIVNFFKKWGLTILAVISGPLGWVVLAVVKNWDKIKSVTSSVFNGIKNIASNVWNSIKSTISNVVEGVKTKVSSVWNSVKSTTTSVWNGIKSAIVKPITAAKDKVKSIIDTIKGFFTNLKLPQIKLPKLKMPHFSISGSFNPLKGQIPKLGVNWYAKGGVFDSPSIIGVGESGKEAVMPLERNTGWIDILASKLNNKDKGNSGGLNLTITNFVNNTDQDIQMLAEKLEFYRNQQTIGGRA